MPRLDTQPLPPISRADSVADGMKIPVLFCRELLPASEFPPTTPHVISVWLTAALSVK